MQVFRLTFRSHAVSSCANCVSMPIVMNAGEWRDELMTWRARNSKIHTMLFFVIIISQAFSLFTMRLYSLRLGFITYSSNCMTIGQGA